MYNFSINFSIENMLGEFPKSGTVRLMLKVILAVLVFGIIGGFVFFNYNFGGSKTKSIDSSPSTVAWDQNDKERSNQGKPLQFTFENPKKSVHFESNTPLHGAILAGAPINIVIDFNFGLAKPSEIKIFNNSKDYGVGETIIDSNKLTMRRNMSPNAPDGLYKVEYKACWPDGSCHNGYFQFVIDRKLSKEFIDQRNQKEVEIKMSQIMFKPQNINISKGTKITWVNDDSVGHDVSTESHHSHSYYKAQNSKTLKKGQSFSTIFNNIGVYPYHCGAHAEDMTGNILVE